MNKLDLGPVKQFLSRVRWISVIGVLVFFIIIALILMNLPQRYKVEGNIGLGVKADPETIKIGERTTVEVEIKNMDKYEDTIVTVEAETHDDNFLFVKTEKKIIIQESIPIGPNEVRKIEFDVRAKPNALSGTYGVDVKAYDKLGSEVERTIQVDVVRE